MERAGCHALSVFARALSARVLRAHADGPLSSGELEERLGWAADASLRAATAEFCELGALERGGRQPVATRLTAAGNDLLSVADALERWLSHSAFGPLDLSDPAARGTVRALVAGWESTVVQALAERPRSLADLSPQITAHSYPALKRRFARLRTATLVAPVDARARSPEYEATPLLRRAVAPLSLAARWERDHLAGAGSIDTHDLGAALLLALPLAELPPGAFGSCELAATAHGSDEDAEPSPATISLVVKEGKIASLSAGAVSVSETWALGPAEAWLDAMIDGQLAGLLLRATNSDLAAAVIDGVHLSLFSD